MPSVISPGHLRGVAPAAPPIPAQRGALCCSNLQPRLILRGASGPPSGGPALHSVNESDGDLDTRALAQEVEENLDPPVLGAGALDDRDQSGQRSTPDLHTITGLEARLGANHTALV